MTAWLPGPNYAHLLRLIDDTGIYEHALYSVPRRSHGYTVDDAARALLVLLPAPSTPEIIRAREVLMALLLDAIGEGGDMHNRLGFDRRWSDSPHHGDHLGRAAWALGRAAVAAPEATLAEAARAGFEVLALPRGEHMRPYAFHALGAAEILTVSPDHLTAARVAELAVDRLQSGGRPWPEGRLTYANGRIPQALLTLGDAIHHPRLLDQGLEMLEWLAGVERSGDHVSFTPVGGWEPGDPRPGFDQQSIEAAAYAGAALAAWRITGESRWADEVRRAGRWFMGDNDSGVMVLDPATGAGFDGLEKDGVNRNQGAESTIAALAVLQACAEVGSAD